MTQSNAILRYIGREFDMLGHSKESASRVDVILEEGMDFRNRTVKMAYGRESAGYEASFDSYSETLGANLNKYEAWIGLDDYFAGYEVTVADFVMYELLEQNKLMVEGCLDDFPRLEARRAHTLTIALILIHPKPRHRRSASASHSWRRLQPIFPQIEISSSLATTSTPLLPSTRFADRRRGGATLKRRRPFRGHALPRPDTDFLSIFDA